MQFVKSQPGWINGVRLFALLFPLWLGTGHGLATTSNVSDSSVFVNTEWLAQHLDDPGLVVLCVADDDAAYSRAHIPGAQLVRISDLVIERNQVPNQLPDLDQLQRVFERAGVKTTSRIVLYGDREGIFAARAYFTLDYLGLAKRASLLDGGFEKWRQENRPVSQNVPRITPSMLRVSLHPEVLIDRQRLPALLAQPTALLLDARPVEEYAGERYSEDVSQAGHIPGAVSLYWGDLLRAGDVPALRSKEDLRRVFEQTGAGPSKELIVYCRTGMQSSLDYAVAKYLGYRVRMYVGSFYEWSRESGKVERKPRAHGPLGCGPQ